MACVDQLPQARDSGLLADLLFAWNSCRRNEAEHHRVDAIPRDFAFRTAGEGARGRDSLALDRPRSFEDILVFSYRDLLLVPLVDERDAQVSRICGALARGVPV